MEENGVLAKMTLRLDVQGHTPPAHFLSNLLVRSSRTP